MARLLRQWHECVQYALDCRFPSVTGVLNAVRFVESTSGRAVEAVAHINERGWTLVHMAAASGNLMKLRRIHDDETLAVPWQEEFVRLDTSNFTPLNCAEHAGFQEVVDALAQWIDDGGGQ